MFNFLKYRLVYFLISLVVIGAGLFSIWKWGYIYSIDFVGGTNVEYQLNKDVPDEKIKMVLEKNSIELQNYSYQNSVLTFKTKFLDEAKEKVVRKSLEKDLGVTVTVLRSETVGPTLGKETMMKTIIASGVAILGILIYLTFAFKGIAFALSAIVALLHDFLVVVGVYSLFSHFFKAEVDTLFVTAILTTMSFSVHDTIVIFDKIREYRKSNPTGDVVYYANKALSETMVRSLNNSMTIVFMLLALLLLGGTTIKFFIATLLVGTLTGTYSSPFVATPVLVWLEKMKKR